MRKTVLWIVLAIVALALVGGGVYYATRNKKTSGNTNGQTNSQPTPTTNNSQTAINNSVVITKSNSAVGEYLADPSGKTLYTFNGDEPGVSNCTGSCLATWPAYQDTGTTTGLPNDFSTIKRSDNGQTQYTFNNMPLYFWQGDTQPGQVTGNGVSNFTVAKP